MWTRSKRPVRPILEGGLSYAKIAFVKPTTHTIEIGGAPWSMETSLVVIKNLFADESEGLVSVSGIKTVLTPIVGEVKLNHREQVVVTALSFYSNLDKIMILRNDYGIHEVGIEEN